VIENMGDFRALDPFFRIIEQGLAELVDGEHFFDLLADDVVFDFIITVPNYPRHIVGRDNLIELYRGYGSTLFLDRCYDLRVYPSPSTSSVVLEYSSEGRVVTTGQPYSNRYISVVVIKDSKLVLIGSGGLGPEVGWTPRLLSAPGAELLLPVMAAPAMVAFGDRVWSWLAPLGVPSARAAEAWSAYSSLSNRPARAAFLRTLRSVVDHRGQAVSAFNRLHFSSGLPTLLIWGDHDRINPVAHAGSEGSELLRLHDLSLSVPSVVGPLRNISRNLPICSSSLLASTAESTGSRLT
jgi:ketosteroid isomerase-like protein